MYVMLLKIFVVVLNLFSPDVCSDDVGQENDNISESSVSSTSNAAPGTFACHPPPARTLSSVLKRMSHIVAGRTQVIACAFQRFQLYKSTAQFNALPLIISIPYQIVLSFDKWFAFRILG